MTTRNYSNTAAPVALGTAVNSSVGTFLVSTTAGFPTAPFTAVIDRGSSDEEAVLVTAKSSNSFTVTRGYDGTSAHSHDVGSPIEHVTLAIDYREANAHINDDERDDHPQYLTEDRALALDYTGVTGMATIPVGLVLPYVGASAPTSDWMICNGAAISRGTYSALFALMGIAWGNGNGVSTFNIPDMRGAFPLGKSFNGDLLDANTQTLGEDGGREYVTLTEYELPSHTHTDSGHYHAMGTHSHTGTTSSSGAHSHRPGNTDLHFLEWNDGAGSFDATGGTGIDTNPNTESTGAHTHTFTTALANAGNSSSATANIGAAGSGLPLNIMPPFVVFNYIIRVLP